MEQPTSRRKFKANRNKVKNIIIDDPKPKQKISILLEKFLLFCSGNKGLKPKTILTYRDNTSRLIKWLENNYEITDPDEVTDEHIIMYPGCL
jgi:hypothetical protein